MGRYYKAPQPVFVDGNMYEPPFEILAKAALAVDQGIDNGAKTLELINNLKPDVLSTDEEYKNLKLQQIAFQTDDFTKTLAKDPMGFHKRLPELRAFGREIDKELQTGRLGVSMSEKAYASKWYAEQMERAKTDKNIKVQDIENLYKSGLTKYISEGGTRYDEKTGKHISMSTYLPMNVIADPDLDKQAMEIASKMKASSSETSHVGTDGKWIRKSVNDTEQLTPAEIAAGVRSALYANKDNWDYLNQQKEFGLADNYTINQAFERAANAAAGIFDYSKTKSGITDMSADPYAKEDYDQAHRLELKKTKEGGEDINESTVTQETLPTNERDRKLLETPGLIIKENNKRISEIDTQLKDLKSRGREGSYMWNTLSAEKSGLVAEKNTATDIYRNAGIAWREYVNKLDLPAKDKELLKSKDPYTLLREVPPLNLDPTNLKGNIEKQFEYTKKTMWKASAEGFFNKRKEKMNETKSEVLTAPVYSFTMSKESYNLEDINKNSQEENDAYRVLPLIGKEDVTNSKGELVYTNKKGQDKSFNMLEVMDGGDALDVFTVYGTIKKNGRTYHKAKFTKNALGKVKNVNADEFVYIDITNTNADRSIVKKNPNSEYTFEKSNPKYTHFKSKTQEAFSILLKDPSTKVEVPVNIGGVRKTYYITSQGSVDGKPILEMLDERGYQVIAPNGAALEDAESISKFLTQYSD